MIVEQYSNFISYEFFKGNCLYAHLAVFNLFLIILETQFRFLVVGKNCCNTSLAIRGSESTATNNESWLLPFVMYKENN